MKDNLILFLFRLLHKLQEGLLYIIDPHTRYSRTLLAEDLNEMHEQLRVLARKSERAATKDEAGHQALIDAYEQLQMDIYCIRGVCEIFEVLCLREPLLKREFIDQYSRMAKSVIARARATSDPLTATTDNIKSVEPNVDSSSQSLHSELETESEILAHRLLESYQAKATESTSAASQVDSAITVKSLDELNAVLRILEMRKKFHSEEADRWGARALESGDNEKLRSKCLARKRQSAHLEAIAGQACIIQGNFIRNLEEGR